MLSFRLARTAEVVLPIPGKQITITGNPRLSPAASKEQMGPRAEWPGCGNDFGTAVADLHFSFPHKLRFEVALTPVGVP